MRRRARRARGRRDTRPDGIRLLPLVREPMVLLCHPDHPLADAGRVPLGTLGGEAFVDFHPDWGSRAVTDRAFAAAGTARRVALEVNDVHTPIDLVRYRLGVAVVPRPVSRKEPAATLRAVPLAEEHFWQVNVAAGTEERTGPAAREVLSYLAEERSARRRPAEPPAEPPGGEPFADRRPVARRSGAGAGDGPAGQ